jgi:hypothetical protein
MSEHARPVRRERRRGALDDVGGNVIESAAGKHAGDLDDLEVSDRESTRGEPLAAALGEQVVQAFQVARDRARDEPLAFALLLLALEREGRAVLALFS